MGTIDEIRAGANPATETACITAVERTDLVRRLNMLDPVERDQATTSALAYLIGAVVENDTGRVAQAAEADRLRGELDIAVLHLEHMHRQLTEAGLPDTFVAQAPERRLRSRGALTVPMVTDDVAALLHELTAPFVRPAPELFEQTATGAITTVPREPDDGGVDDVGVLDPSDPLVAPSSLDTGMLPVLSGHSMQVPAPQPAPDPVTLEHARALELARVGHPQVKRWWRRRKKL